MRNVANTGAAFSTVYFENDRNGLGIVLISNENEDVKTIVTPGETVTDVVVKTFNSVAGQMMMRRNKEKKFRIFETAWLFPPGGDASAFDKKLGLDRVGVSVEYARTTDKPSPDFEGEELKFSIVAGGGEKITKYAVEFVDIVAVTPVNYWREQFGLPPAPSDA